MNWLAALRKSLREAPWHLWTAQVAAILRIELKKNFRRRRSLWIYLLALAPVLLIAVHAIHSPLGRHCNLDQDTQVMAGIFQMFYLRLGIFFGCLGMFTWLFRGEVVHRSLHYYFLAPVRREVLIVGKFLAGLITAGILFVSSVFLSFALMYGHFGSAGLSYVLHGPGLDQLLAYLGVTLLACAGYGAMFITLSLFIKNPIIPGAFLLVWETFHPVLPPLMQKLSVMFYLTQLSPVPAPPGGILALFSVIVEPVSPWFAVPGLLLLSATVLVVACVKIRRIEISYLTD